MNKVPFGRNGLGHRSSDVIGRKEADRHMSKAADSNAPFIAFATTPALYRIALMTDTSFS